MAKNPSSFPSSKSHSAEISVEQKNEASRVVATASIHEGPLPSPQALEYYDRVLPGAAREIMEMAKLEQRNRHKMGLLYWVANFSGQLFAFFLGALGLGGSIYLLAIDKTITGLSTLLLSLATLAGPFYYSRRPSRTAQRKL